MENLIYLTAGIPSSVNYPVEIANRLNEKGLKPSRGEAYTPTIVRNVVYARSSDEKVKIELIRLLAEHENKGGLVSKHLDAAMAILNA